MREDALGAFCGDTDACLAGAKDGPLAGLTFAAKDIFDVAGHVTGGGNPDWRATHAPAERTAWAVEALVDASASMVGKTITDEITRGIFGENPHYGTPVNPKAPDRVPGGSSSGSASAVAGDLVDFALGSDTGGSVRVPSSFCGLYGLRPTHGRVPFDGVLVQAPSFDTIGWFARDPAMLARVGAVLLQTSIGDAHPSQLVIAEDAFEVAQPAVAAALRPLVSRIGDLIGDVATARLAEEGLALWAEHQGVLQGREAWVTAGDWIDRVNPRFGFDVSERFVAARAVTDEQVKAGNVLRMKVRQRMEELLAGGVVVCLPSTPTPAPLRGEPLSIRRIQRGPISMLTCIAGLTGGPQISLPLAEVDGLPVGLSLLGAPGADQVLLGFAMVLAKAL